MKSKKGISRIIFGAAILVALLCIAQLAIYIPSQISMLNDALAGGAEKSKISDYYMQELIPQIIAYVINGFGISVILFAIGTICCKKADTDVVSDEAIIDEAISEFVEEYPEEADEISEPENAEEDSETSKEDKE